LHDRLPFIMPRLFARISIALSLAIAAVSARAQSATPPTIASISKSQTVTEGASIAFSVSVNGTAPFTYQWRKDGATIAGATNSAWSIDPVRVDAAGSYTVEIGNVAGSVTGGPVLLAVNPAKAPTFSYQPSDVTATVGGSLSIYLSVYGTSPLMYEWKKDGVVVADATSSSFSKSNVQLSDAGTYTVTVKNVAGTVTSSPFTVRVNPMQPPTVSVSDRTVSMGDSIWIYSSVSGDGSITYQWSKDGVPISGAVSYYFSKSNAQASDAGTYTLTATNAAGSSSASAKLTVLPPVAPTISSSPSNVTVTIGASFSLGVSVSGTSPISYQWYKDGAVIAGATSSSYSKSAAQASDAGAYKVIASNPQGTATSATALVTVTNAQAQVITSMPSMLSVRAGQSFPGMGVQTSGSGTRTYQWMKDGVAIPGATDSSYYPYRTIASSDAGLYTVVVTSSAGSITSPGCRLLVLPPLGPVITENAPSRTVRQGQSVALGGTVAGTSPFTYQWRKDGTAIPGATSSMLSLQRVASSDAGAYSFTVSNASGSVSSENATLTVLPARLPVFTYSPASTALLPGETTSLNVSVSSDSTYTLQWYRNGTAISGATSSYWYITGQPGDAGTYTVVATNSAGSATSRESVVSVQATRPVITYTSGGCAVAGGASASISVQTSGSNDTVQWFKDGVVIPNATTKNYSFSNFGRSSVGVYTAQVTSGQSTFTSSPIVLEMMSSGQSPVITESPHSITGKAGNGAYFSVQADGETPITYQWKKDGVAIPGQTSTGYSFTPSANSVGSYTVEVTNRNGSVTSAAARYSVRTDSNAPVIVAGPFSQTVTAGSSSLSVGVSLEDAAGATFQWYKNGTAVSGGTNSNLYYYVTANATHSGRYYAVVTNSVGSITSEEAVITVNSKTTGPQFTTQPASITVYRGTAVTLTAAATGTGTVSFQWKKDGVAIAGATGTTLSLTNVQDADTATYTVVATDSVGSVSSMPAVLTVSSGIAPAIVTSPVSTTAYVGGTLTLTGLASGVPGPTYQWKRDGVVLTGMTSATLTITNVTSSDAGKYSFVAMNPIGSATSSEATVTVLIPPPVISGQPQGGTYAPGSTVVLKVTATGSGTLTYQWYRNSVLIDGATGDTLTLEKLSGAQAGTYTVVVSNGTSKAASQPTVISVSASPFAGIYSGTTSEGESWALDVPTQGGATFLAYLKTRELAVVARDLVIAADGTFQYASPAATTTFERRFYRGQITGRITNGALTGQLTDLGVDFSGSLNIENAGQLGGYFRAVTYEADISELHIIKTRAGTMLLVGVDALGVRGTRTDVSVDSFLVTFKTLSYQYSVHMMYGGEITADMQTPSGEWVKMATAPRFGAVQKLVDVSTRGLSGSSGARMLTAGFFVKGNVSKKVLIRAVGPELTRYGLDGNVMQNPRVRLLNDRGVTIADNDDWDANSGSYFAKCGAFALTQGSKDSAMVATLDPGLYSAQVYSDSPDTNGIALVEVYDAESSTGPKLINISTRGYVDGGSSVLIAGVAVTGVAPKKVLIRAVGPRLRDFNVPESLADPKLTIYKGTTPLVSNDNWGDASDPEALASAAATSGGFDLKQGSKDSAMLIYLAPGNYTAQVSGVDGATGIALVEVYEVK
jgi:hypothetical protein